MFEIGSAVQWKEDPNYKGIVWEINKQEGTAYVEFLYPSCFSQRIALDEIELSGTNPITQAIQDTTRLSPSEIDDLRKLYIELALATHDQEWFEELVNGKGIFK